MDAFSLPLLLLYATLYGVLMKLADLFDEHGLHWFPGDALLTGLGWGFFGSLLLLGNPGVANVILAQQLAYIIRRRLDYLNHALAATMIILTFLARASFDAKLFGIFFGTFILFGSLRDYLGDIRKTKDRWYRINEIAWYYFIPPAIYGATTGNWLLFFVFATYRLAYNAVKYGFFSLGLYRKF